MRIKMGKIIRKIFVTLLILGFFANIFSNFPFKILAAKLGNDQAKEIILNNTYQENSRITEEVKEVRKASEKTFKKSDGSLETYYYDRPIHKYVEDKGYEEIDATFQNEGEEYNSDALQYNLKLPKKIHENKKIKLSYQNTKIEITYNNINKVTATNMKQSGSDLTDLTRLEGNVRYNEIYNGIDLEYLTSSINVKENIIMKKYIETFTFSYNIKITNLTLIEEMDYLYFVNEKNEVIYQMDPYYMTDNMGKSSLDLKVNIEKMKKDEYKVEVIPNDDWLKKASYPVIIDPTINYNNNIIDSKMTIRGFNKGNSTSTIQNHVSIGKYINSVTHEDLSRISVMRLDISELPKNVTYLDAKLKMYATTDNIISQTVSLNEITSNLAFESIKGTTHYNKAYLSTQKRITNHFYEFQVIDAINRNIEDGEVILEFSPDLFTTNDSEVGFYGPSSTLKPMLVINYYETSGLKDYWTYHSVDVGSAGVMYVNDFSGNLVIEKADYMNESKRASFNISHYYNSSEASINLGYGKGWRLNYAQIMKSLSGIVGLNTNNYYTYIDGTGYKSYYKKKGILNENIPESAYYLSEDGENAKIEIGASYTDYYRRIIDDTYTYKYNAYGELIFICDEKMSNYISISYNELPSGLRVISQISDTIGNQAIFTYTDDLLKELTINKKSVDESGGAILEDGNVGYETALTICYEYDNNQNLVSILEKVKDTNHIKASAKYEYDINGRLNALYDCQGQINSGNKEGLFISYTKTSKKVERYEIIKYDKNQSLNNLPAMNMTYQKGMTIFKDNNNYQTNYIFDLYGHTINLYDSDGYAQFYKYESNNNNSYLNNKLLKTSDAIYNVYNIINNHSFEKFQSAYDIPDWQIINGTSNLVKNVSLDSTNNLYGRYALRIKNDNQNATPSVTQTIKLKGDKTYQLAYFAKVKENNGYSGGGAYIEIEAQDSSGNIVTTSKEYVLPSENYSQYIKSFTIGGYDVATYDVTIRLTTSYGTTAYFDNLSFISSMNDCRNNLLSDASFENSYQNTNHYFWKGGEVIEREPSHIYGNYEMLVGSNSTLSQTLDVNIKKKTTLSFGGYINTNKNKVKMRIRFYNLLTDTFSNYYTIEFNDTIDQYQYLVENVTLDMMDEAHQVTVEIINEGSTNIYVDNLVLLEDVYKNKYEYNEYGKTTKVTSNNQTIHITRADGKDISKIEYENIDVHMNKSSLSNYDKTKIDVEGTMNNVATTTYRYQAGVDAENIIGDTTSKYFVTSTRYSSGYQYISSIVDEFGNTTKYDYNSVSGLLEKVIDAKNNSTNYIYDDYERLIQIISNSRNITYTYDVKGRVSTVETGDDNNYIKYQFTYNGYDDVIAINYTSNEALGYQNIISCEYYVYNNLYTGLNSKIIYPNGTYIRYEYNDKLNISKVFEKNDSNGEEKLVSKYVYNELGLVSIYYDIKDDMIYYNNYDTEGKLTKVLDSNNNEIQYFYDDKKNISKIEYHLEDIEGVVEFNYDEDGNKNKVKHQGIETILENENDPLGRYFTKLVKNNNTNILTYQYTYYEHSSMQQSNIEENNPNNLSSYRIEQAEVTVGNQKYIYQYTYDELGNIVTYFEIVTNMTTNEAMGNKRYDYEYDQYNQLTKEKVGKLNSDKNEYTTILECSYTYDNIGNMTRINRTIKQDEYETVPTNIVYNYNDINNKTRLTSYSIDGVTFTANYDLNGNLLQYQQYNAEFTNGKLILLKENDQIKYRFTYDNDGRRTKKEVYNEETDTYDLVEYIYVGDLLVGEKQNNQIIEYIYDEQNLIGFKITKDHSTENYYYVKNLQSDITKIMNAFGEEVVSYIYDAYGNIVSIEGNKKDTIGKINPYRYKGYYYDEGSNLYYCYTRYYSPMISRWISEDSINYLNQSSINGQNLYIYCSNNPTMNLDIKGTWGLKSVFTAIAVVALVVAVTAVCVASAGTALAAVGATVSLGMSASTAFGVAGIATCVFMASMSAAECFTDELTLSKEKSKSKDRYTVYTLRDKNNNVQYVGRTKDYETRMKAHERSATRGHLKPYIEQNDLSYEEARGLEQSLMFYYHTIDKENPMNNQINGIGNKNPLKRRYIKSILKIFDNYVTDELLNLLER